ncbi:5,6-dimethylbenzimidazole synthase [Bosea sp. Root381]|nr:5,6-dimethylbenzimidazole synthase [Bosea sp. Root381]
MLAWRRDVRRFRCDALPEGLIEELLAQAELSPSVGHSQPWRWVRVAEEAQREAVRESFLRCNAEALAAYEGERAQLYARLKLEGMREAPEQIAVFCDHGTAQGHGLGRRTMPETLDYSVVAAITQFWLAARVSGLGVGWVSILEPEAVRRALGTPPEWKLIAWLCIGWPEGESDVPELVRAGWEKGR